MKLNFTEKNKAFIESRLLDVLPHGSGIDCNWEFVWLKNESVICKNSFHCMNDNGYYDGYADFSVKFHPTKCLSAFSLSFNGKTAQNKNKQYMLRDYLEEDIYQSLPKDSSLLTISLRK